MSILIKGIDLPKGNDLIEVMIDKDGYTMVNVKPNSILLGDGRTQAIQIPTPHGRLKDGDEMQGKAYERYFNNTISPYGLYEVNRAIENAPTILEAEE